MSVQQVTPELRQWIVAQATAGQAPEAVLKSMMDSGWNEDVATVALEETLRGFLVDHAKANGLPPPVVVPEPMAVEGEIARRRRPAGPHPGYHAQPARHRLRRAALAR